MKKFMENLKSYPQVVPCQQLCNNRENLLFVKQVTYLLSWVQKSNRFGMHINKYNQKKPWYFVDSKADSFPNRAKI